MLSEFLVFLTEVVPSFLLAKSRKSESQPSLLVGYVVWVGLPLQAVLVTMGKEKLSRYLHLTSWG